MNRRRDIDHILWELGSRCFLHSFGINHDYKVWFGRICLDDNTQEETLILSPSRMRNEQGFARESGLRFLP